MNKFKVLLAVLIFSVLTAGMALSVSAAEIRVFFDGVEIAYDVPPQSISDRTMVPLRATVEAITGQPMNWDGGTRTVTFTAGGHTNTHTIGSTIVYADGTAVEFDAPSLIIDGRTLVPVRMIAETTGKAVRWDGANRYVIITSPVNVAPPPVTIVPIEPIPAPISIPPVPEAPSIIRADYSRLSVPPGQPVTVTAITNDVVNNVWLDLGDSRYVDATISSATATEITWTASFYPNVTRDVYLNANVSRADLGATKRAQRITVTDPPISIINHTANRTSLREGESIIFTITTTDDIYYVWLAYDNTSTNAVYRRTEGIYKLWEATIYPQNSQQVNIYANATYTQIGAAQKQQQVTVNKEVVAIYNVYASATTIPAGDVTEIRVETSRGLDSVRVEFDGITFRASRVSSVGQTDIWSASIRPTITQNVRVTAYSSNNLYGTAVATINIVVYGVVPPPVPPVPPVPPPPVPPVPPPPFPPAPLQAVIHSASADPAAITTDSRTLITVVTSPNVSRIEFNVASGPGNMHNEYLDALAQQFSLNVLGNRVWEAEFRVGEATGVAQIRIFAYDRESGTSDERNVQITVS